MAGLSTTGFERKRLSEIKTEIENGLKTQFGSDIDLRAESVFGQVVGVLALPISELWEEAENVFLAFDPDQAEGVSLDSLAALTGVTRIEATATKVDAILYGQADTVIPSLSEARNATTEDVYCLDSAATISLSNLVRSKIQINTVTNSTDYTITINGVDYTVTSDANATEDEILLSFDAELSAVDEYDEVNVLNQVVLKNDDFTTPFTIAVSANLTVVELGSPGVFSAKTSGAIFIPVGSLSEIQTSVAGWESVENIVDGVSGRDIESDSELRLRRRQSVSFPATATVDSILSKLLQVDDLQAAKVYENNSDITDSNSVPAHSIWVIAEGGEDEDIAQIIYETKAGGIGTHGDTTVDYESESGQEYAIKFERPTQSQLHISMTILPTDGYQAESPDLIKEAVAQWVADNISIGDKLKYSRLFTPINSVTGFEVTELLIGKAASPTGEVSLTAAIDEIITSQTVNISITVTE